MSRNRATLPALSCAMSWARVQQAQYRAWWTPVINAPLTILIKSPPELYWPNNVRISLPWPTRVWAYRISLRWRHRNDRRWDKRNEPGYSEMISALEAQKEAIVAELPEGTVFRPSHSGRNVTISTRKESVRVHDGR